MQIIVKIDVDYYSIHFDNANYRSVEVTSPLIIYILSNKCHVSRAGAGQHHRGLIRGKISHQKKTSLSVQQITSLKENFHWGQTSRTKLSTKLN